MAGLVVSTDAVGPARAATAITPTTTLATSPTITYVGDSGFAGNPAGGTLRDPLECGPGSALTGLTLYVDPSNGYGTGLRPLCTTVTSAGGLLGAQTPLQQVVLGFGAADGNYDSSCPYPSVVTGVVGQSGAFIDALTNQCATLADGALTPAAPAPVAIQPAHTGGSSYAIGCPTGQFAIGINARTGQRLDGFSLRCGTLTLPLTISSLSVNTGNTCGVSCNVRQTGPGASDVNEAAIPAYDLSAVATDAVASAPLRSVPLRSVPLRSVPLRSVPLRSVPLRSVPLQSTLLSQIPLTGTTWQQLLSSTPNLASAPLESVTLLQALTALDTAGVQGPTLDQVDLSQTPLAHVSVASVYLGSSGIGSLPIPAPPGATTDGTPFGSWCAWLSSLGYSCAGLGLTATSPVLAADLAGVPLRSVPLRSVPLRSVPVDAPLRSVPLRSVPVAGSPLRSVPLRSLTLTAPNALGRILVSSIRPASGIGNIPLSTTAFPSGVVNCAVGTATCTNLGEAIASGSIVPGTTLSQLIPVLGDNTLGDLGVYGDATIGDLADAIDPAYPLTLGDVLLALVPTTAVAWERLALDPLQLQQYAGENAPIVPYTVDLTLAGLADTATGDLTVTLPPGFRYAGNNGLLTGETATVVGQEVRLHLVNRAYPASTSVVVLANPGLSLGLYPTVTAKLSLTSTGHGQVTATAATTETDGGVRVDDVAELVNNDPATAPIVLPDHLVLGHISKPGDVDYYRLPVPPAGTHIHVLLSHLPTDDDLVVYGPPDAVAAPNAAPLRSVPLRSVPLLDNGITTNNSTTSPGPQLLNDIPRLATLPLQGQSAHHGTDDEEVGALSSGSGGFLTLQVSGYNGASSNQPYLLRVVEDTPVSTPCTTSGLGQQALNSSGLPVAPGSTRSLLLVDRQQLAAEYGDPTVTPLMSQLTTFAARSDVAGLVVPVDADPGTVTAYNSWNDDPCNSSAANAVVSAINRVVRGYKNSVPGITSVTLVGSDSQLPMFRTPDLTLSANESGYAETDAPASGDTPASRDNPLSASQRQGDLLTDDAYGSVTPVSWLDRRLYLPDLAVGRLLETPAEISGQLTQFVTAGGALTPASALTTGYDFLADGARSVDGALARAVGTGSHTTLIDDPGTSTTAWTRAQLDAALFPSTGSPYLASINAHFDHNRALPSAGNATNNQTELYTVADISGHAGDRLAGRLLFSMGCHAGLNVPDRYVGTTSGVAKDWAQTLAVQKAIWVANTGFGLGDTATVALSEELMRQFATRLDGSMSAGQALQYAKQAYFGSLGAYGVYDEKAMTEAVFYGLPMWRVGGPTSDGAAVTAVPAPITAVTQIEPTAANASTSPTTDAGLAAADVTITPTFTDRTITGQGRFWSVGGEAQVTHYRPIQPRTSVGIPTISGVTAHGALLTALTSVDVRNVDPVVARPTIDLAANEPEASFTNTAFPAQFQNLTTFTTPGGVANRLVLLPGQFFSDPGATSGTQRLFTTMTSRVLYSDATSYLPPQLTNATAAHGTGTVTFSVDISPQNGASVGTAFVLYHAPGTSQWSRVPLTPPGTGSTYTTGPVTTAAADVEWFAQAADTFGNTGTTDDKGDLFGAQADFTSSVDGTPGSGGWYTTAVTVNASGPAGRYSVVVDGSSVGTAPATVVAEGVHTVVLVGSDASRHVLPNLKIDTVAPTLAFTSPVGGVFRVNGPGAFAAVCTDGPVGSGVASGCPSSGTVNTTVPGPGTVSATVTDVAGNSSRVGLPYTVTWSFAGFFSPVSNTAVNAAKAGSTVPVKFSLQDATGFVGALTNVSTIDWQRYTCVSGAPVSYVALYDTALSTLKYDATANQYVYTWKTTAPLAGTCQRFVLTLKDGTDHVALFAFR